jgi:hypothetical protein
MKLLNLLFICFPLISFSQSTWRNGIITLKDGTNVPGQINDLEWNYGHKEIEFRKSDHSIEKYSVNDLLSFSTDRPALYESHSISYDGDLQDLRHLSLPMGRETENPISDKLFLMVKVNAPIGLLYMKDKNGRPHYFLKQDTVVQELLNRNYQHPTVNETILTNKRYKQQLHAITNDCPEIQSRLKTLLYDDKWLIGVITKINQCKNHVVIPISKDEKPTERRPSSFGMSFQLFKVGFNYPDFYHSRGNTSINFGGGIFWELYSKKRPNRISLYSELAYKVIQPQEGRLESDVVALSRIANFECTKIKLTNALRASYPQRGGGRFYWGLGANYGFRNGTMIQGRSNILSIYGELEEFSSGFEIGAVGMIGETFLLFKTVKINTELRYEFEFESAHLFSFNNYGIYVQIGLK